MTPEFKPETIKLVVGLGNPGTRYTHTFHNVGRLVVCTLAGVPETKFKPSPHYCLHRDAERTFAVPRTFMNESGPAVKHALRALRLKPHALLLVHDDADLALGTYRLAWGRGAAGHHGVESVFHALGTKEFWRLRIGIRPPRLDGESRLGPPSPRRAKADTFVLRPMPRTAETAVRTVAETIRAILQTSE
jgi:PTH1 family peptidyl-tRNA hydrolase